MGAYCDRWAWEQRQWKSTSTARVLCKSNWPLIEAACTGPVVTSCYADFIWPAIYCVETGLSSGAVSHLQQDSFQHPPTIPPPFFHHPPNFLLHHSPIPPSPPNIHHHPSSLQHPSTTPTILTPSLQHSLSASHCSIPPSLGQAWPALSWVGLSTTEIGTSAWDRGARWGLPVNCFPQDKVGPREYESEAKTPIWQHRVTSPGVLTVTLLPGSAGIPGNTKPSWLRGHALLVKLEAVARRDSTSHTMTQSQPGFWTPFLSYQVNSWASREGSPQYSPAFPEPHSHLAG